MNKFFYCLTKILTILALFIVISSLNAHITAYAMPFYSLSPKRMTIRSMFSTEYEKSSLERKHNILLASKSINNYFLEPNGEFSFNKVVGPRTEKRGYKNAKIIFDGEFIDGVGGGVCQVSTTLYNAVLLAGLKVVEYHPHSLPVSYVLPSFDAMVNSGTADLRFVNDTLNPLIIKATADDNTLTVTIIGEALKVEYERQSIVSDTIPAPSYIVQKDVLGEYPDLYEGERLYLAYSKNGIKSQGYVNVYKNKKLINKIKLRSDTYKAVQGKVVEGTKKRPTDLE